MSETIGSKICNRCETLQPLEGFRPNSKRCSGRETICKVCRQAQWHAWYMKNREKQCLAASAYRKADPARTKRILRTSELKTKYGLTPEMYEQMKVAQDNKCALCGDEFTRIPNIDHDHNTGKVRSLLCCTCNPGLGHFREDISLLEKAIEYLLRFRS